MDALSLAEKSPLRGLAAAKRWQRRLLPAMTAAKLPCTSRPGNAAALLCTALSTVRRTTSWRLRAFRGITSSLIQQQIGEVGQQLERLTRALGWCAAPEALVDDVSDGFQAMVLARITPQPPLFPLQTPHVYPHLTATCDVMLCSCQCQLYKRDHFPSLSPLQCRR